MHIDQTRSWRPVLFYALSFAIAWAAWTPLLLHKQFGMQLPLPYPIALFVCQTLGAFAPLLAVAAVGRITRDAGLVGRTLKKIRFRAVPVYWFVAAALTPIVLVVSTSLVQSLGSDGLTILRPEPLRELGWALLAVVPFFFVVALIGSPLGEEPGWRGYVLDGFATRDRALVGSAIVAVLWWLWHTPLFVVLGVDVNAYSFLEMLGHSLLIDSVFLLSGRNLLMPMLYHQGVNTCFMFFVSGTRSVSGIVLFLAIAVAVRAFAQKHCFPRQQLFARG